MAMNDRGWSVQSDASASGVDVKQTPGTMITPANDATVSN
jgi:hypothetical protein